MVPDPEKTQTSFPKLKYPPYRDDFTKSPYLWLKGKRMHDGAEGLWRIHDDLYDLTDFVELHPGGSQWLLTTKGTDITESFETHHLRGNLAEKHLPKYFVRKAKTPRNYPFTFKEDGFYKTLKAKVAAKLCDIPEDCRRQSNAITDSLLMCLIIGSPICCWFWRKSFVYGAVSTLAVSYILSMITICAHNYFHRADSWRMYLYNLSGFSYREWRVSHAMSHHLHTNTAHDLELSMLEPFLYYLPKPDKTFRDQMASYYFPVIYSFASLGCMLKELGTCILKFENELTWENIIPFLLPAWMWLASGMFLPWVLVIWIAIILLCSLMFMIFGLTAGHHGNTTFFEGDIPSSEEVDWGVHQIHAIVDNMDNSSTHFKTLTRFGDHSLHHLFPTLDHGELNYLYPLVIEHCEKFETQLRTTSFYNAFISQSKQLARKKPHDFRLYGKGL